MASEIEPEDIISTLPHNVVTNILHRLPLQDAVRTAMLSRHWRFKWTKLNELKFDANFFAYLIERKGENSFGTIISRLLLHIHGTVTKSVLILTLLEVEDIHHYLFFLSKRGIKDLTLTYWSKPRVTLPTHFFSCLELTHLNISGCGFNPPPGFHGFPNLTSLDFSYDVQFGGGDLGEFVTRCPLLEILKMGYLCYTGTVKLVEIAKLENLKILSLSLCHLENNVCELAGYFPKVQELGLDFQDCTLTEVGVISKFSAAFPFIKILNLTRIEFSNGIMISRALETIIHFPNLQTLEIYSPLRRGNDPIPVPIPMPEVEYKTIELRNVVFRFFKGSENEIYLVKYFLECAPSLNKIDIMSDIAFDDQLVFVKKLLMLHRASPVAEIDFF